MDESYDNNNNMVYLFISQQGHFRTSSGSFFIEPIEDYADENKNILHLLYRAPQTKSHDELDTENDDLPNAFVGEWIQIIQTFFKCDSIDNLTTITKYDKNQVKLLDHLTQMLFNIYFISFIFYSSHIQFHIHAK